MSGSDAALLVVDDIDDNRFALSRRLARQGYLNVTTAVDGRQALELLNSKSFDLVLLDIMMPTVNGYEVLAQMKASSSLRHIPVIMISAVDEIESVIRCIELGAEDYLPKPFNPTLLRARVGACLERKRLHDQVTARTRELSEALEQQTATSEVLKVISSSPGELQPVFDAILANAVRLCAASFGNLYLRDGEVFRLVAFHNTPPAFVAQRRGRPYCPSPIGPPGRMLRTRAVVHVDDLTTDPSYRERDPGVVAFVELAGTRTVLLVPMLKEGEPIGCLSIYRQEVRPFADKQIELVTELRRAGRHRHREHAVAQRAARNRCSSRLPPPTCSKSSAARPSICRPVLETLVESAARLCEAGYGGRLLVSDGEVLPHVATYGSPPASSRIHEDHPTRARARTGHRPGVARRPDGPYRRCADRPGIHVFGEARTNWRLSHRARRSAAARRNADRRDRACSAQEVRPFTDKQIELVATFADQAVIAIENMRLFDEVQARTRELSESLEQQTATSEVLRVISSSPGELEPVFQAMLANATQTCEAKFGTSVPKEDEFRPDYLARRGIPPALAEHLKRGPHRPPLNRLNP